MSALAEGIGQSFQAALAGLVSFASPCCIPLVPGYLSYLAGVSSAHAPASIGGGDVVVQAPGRWRVTGAAALFVAGFTVVFVAATASVFGLIGLLALNRELLQRIGGVVTIVMGLGAWVSIEISRSGPKSQGFEIATDTRKNVAPSNHLLRNRLLYLRNPTIGITDPRS